MTKGLLEANAFSRGASMRTHLLTTTAVMALLSASTVSTRAQTNWTGAISNDWFTAGNWTAGVPILVTSANIDRATPNSTVISGANATVLNLAVGQSGTGVLVIQNGGTLQNLGSGSIGISTGAQGTVTVSGLGSTWTMNFSNLVVGNFGTGTLTIANGGTVSSGPGGASVGLSPGSNGTVTVTGPGSTLNNFGLIIGGFGTGLLTVADGGVVNGPVTIAAFPGGTGAVLGNGTVGPTNVNAGGFLVPGTVGTIGTLTVAGNLAFQSGAFYVVQVNPTTASSTNVTGTATLAGTVAAVFQPGAYTTRNYPILTADGGLTGRFEAFETRGLPAGFRSQVSYFGNSAILQLRAQLVPESPTPTPPNGTSPTLPTVPPPIIPLIPGLPASEQPAPPDPPGATSATPPPIFTVNQFNVGHAIDNFFNNGGALPPAFASLYNLTGSNLTTALDQLSGEPATGAQKVAFQLTNQFLGLMLDPFVDGRCGIGRTDQPPLGFAGDCEARPSALGFAPERENVPPAIALAYASVLKEPRAPLAPIYEPRWTAWGGAYGGSNRTSGDIAIIGSHDLSASTVGFAAGLDYHYTPDTVLGFALAGGGTNWSLSQGLGGGKSDAFQAGLYGATKSGPAYLAAAFAFTNHWMSTDRIAVFDHLSANFDAQSYGGRLEGGYRFGTPYGGITPYAAIQAQSFHTPGYTETDAIANGFALTFNSRDATDTRSELGTRLDRVLAVYSNAVLALRGRVAWAHDWVSDPTLLPGFQALPGASFIVNGATLPKNSALTSAGAELRVANGVTLLAKFDGEFAAHSSTYAGTGTVRYRW
jgi:T5SS/PEP-CTERM-associated repeat protein